MSDRENVLSGINVSVMYRAAVLARPFSYSKTFPASGASAALTPAAGLGRVRFVNLVKPHACASALVPEHGSQRAPTRIRYAFGMFGSGKFRRADVADEDRAALSYKRSAKLMQEVIPAISDFGLNCPGAISLARALCGCQGRLEVPVKPGRIDRCAVAQGDQRLETKVDSELERRQGPWWNRPLRLRHFNTHVQVPAAACVLAEAPRAQLILTEAEAVPERQPSASEAYLTSPISKGSDLERNPSERAARAAALAPSKLDLPMLGSAPRVLLRRILHSLNGQLQRAVSARASLQVRPKIESRQNPALSSEHPNLQIIAEVPDGVHFMCKRYEPFRVFVLYAHSQNAHVVNRFHPVAFTGHIYSIN
jgi:hypothetical protein